MTCVCGHAEEHHDYNHYKGRVVCFVQVHDIDGSYFVCGCKEFKEVLAAALDERFGPDTKQPT